MISIRVTGNLSKEVNNRIEAERRKKMEAIRETLVADTPIDTGEARDGWAIEGNSIVNRVDHIDDLNRGSSQQAPAFFIEQSVLSHDGVKPNGVIVRND